MLRAILCLILALGAQAQTVQAPSHGKPAIISSADLKDFDALPADRKKLIETALAVARDSPWLRYTDQGADPTKGGFDCSGAMYFVMRKVGLEPPRSSGGQFEWLEENKRLNEVPADAATLDHPSLKKLRPADLLFWGHPEGGRISHVAMYLGTEKKDGLAVMINSTDGRSYRGVQANGYGVYDFRMPKAGSKTIFMGYGTPPGIVAE